nr:MAG TPA: hypothetical protein [Bacteriophage sp.]
MYENAALLHEPTFYVAAKGITHNCVESNWKQERIN